MRGKAWLRTSPYVALPFDSDRVRPELVGLLCFIPSRAARRGEDFFTLRTEVRRVVLQARAAQGSWRRARFQAASTWRTFPRSPKRAEMEDRTTRKTTSEVYSIRGFYSRIFHVDWDIKWFSFNVLYDAWKI